MSVYACSDIHGQRKLFQKILNEIHFSKDDHMYVLGDIIDRGPDSIGLLRQIMSFQNITCLLGNHELMMYTEFLFPYMENFWIDSRNGGLTTKKNFKKLPSEEQKRVLEYIGNMYLQKNVVINGKKFLLSHSDFCLGNKKELSPDLKFCDANYGTALEIVWNSPWRFLEYVPLEKYLEDGKTHVIGHVPVDAIFELQNTAYVDKKHNIINIDLGCARLGKKKEDYALCVMNLSTYAEGKTDSFKYAFWEKDGTIGNR